MSRVLWKGTLPSVEEAKFGVYWVIDHTIKLAPGGVGGPIKLAILRQHEGKWQAENMVDTQEPAQYIEELEGKNSGFARSTINDADAEPLPIAPTPA